MTVMNSYVTVDLGATSGRVVVGRLERGRLEVAEVHRFRNEPSGSGREQHWDAEELFRQTIIGLRHAAAQLDGAAAGMGVTAWGVDVGLLDNNDRLLAPIQHYRAADPEASQHLVDRLGAEELFARTGVLPQPINTVFRIRKVVDAAGAATKSEGVRALLVPDLWCALLTGARAAERSIASTTGLVSLRTGTWDMGLLDAVGGTAKARAPRSRACYRTRRLLVPSNKPSTSVLRNSSPARTSYAQSRCNAGPRAWRPLRHLPKSPAASRRVLRLRTDTQSISASG